MESYILWVKLFFQSTFIRVNSFKGKSFSELILRVNFFWNQLLCGCNPMWVISFVSAVPYGCNGMWVQSHVGAIPLGAIPLSAILLGEILCWGSRVSAISCGFNPTGYNSVWVHSCVGAIPCGCDPAGRNHVGCNPTWVQSCWVQSRVMVWVWGNPVGCNTTQVQFHRCNPVGGIPCGGNPGGILLTFEGLG